MANVLNRTTKQYLTSVNTPDFPIASWIISPDVSSVAGFDTKYWTITGDVVSLMTPAERAAVDTAELSARRDGVAASLDGVEDVMRAFALTLLDELNLHAARTTAILNAIDGAATFAAMKTAIAAVVDPPQRTVAQLKTALRSKLGT